MNVSILYVVVLALLYNINTLADESESRSTPDGGSESAVPECDDSDDCSNGKICVTGECQRDCDAFDFDGFLDVCSTKYESDLSALRVSITTSVAAAKTELTNTLTETLTERITEAKTEAVNARTALKTTIEKNRATAIAAAKNKLNDARDKLAAAAAKARKALGTRITTLATTVKTNRAAAIAAVKKDLNDARDKLAAAAAAARTALETKIDNVITRAKDAEKALGEKISSTVKDAISTATKAYTNAISTAITSISKDRTNAIKKLREDLEFRLDEIEKAINKLTTVEGFASAAQSQMSGIIGADAMDNSLMSRFALLFIIQHNSANQPLQTRATTARTANMYFKDWYEPQIINNTINNKQSVNIVYDITHMGNSKLKKHTTKNNLVQMADTCDIWIFLQSYITLIHAIAYCLVFKIIIEVHKYVYKTPVLILSTILTFKNVYADGAFTFWPDSSFVRNVVAIHNGFIGGVAFASDGDILSNGCTFENPDIYRFDTETTTIISGSTIFAETILTSGVGRGFCGMTNHPNGKLYVNTLSGVQVRDPNTNAFLEGSYGPAGNILGIAVKGEDVYYVSGYSGSGATYKLDTTTNIVTLFGTHNYWVDAISWNGDETILWHAGRSPNFRLIGLDIDGNVIHSLPLVSEPDGIAYHACSNSIFINNLDGTITRIIESDLNNHVLFAAGGFRGDLSAVGSNGCWYITQAATRFEDGTVTNQNSIVEICDVVDPCFVPSVPVRPCYDDISEWKVDQIGKSSQFIFYNWCDSNQFIKIKMDSLIEYDSNSKATKNRINSFAGQDFEFTTEDIQYNSAPAIKNTFDSTLSAGQAKDKTDIPFILETIVVLELVKLKWSVDIQDWPFEDDANTLTLCVNIMTNGGDLNINDFTFEAPEEATYDLVFTPNAVHFEEDMEKRNENHRYVCYTFNSFDETLNYDPSIQLNSAKTEFEQTEPQTKEQTKQKTENIIFISAGFIIGFMILTISILFVCYYTAKKRNKSVANTIELSESTANPISNSTSK